MKYTEHKEYLKKSSDLELVMACPKCSTNLNYPDYRCENCKIEISYFLPIKQ